MNENAFTRKEKINLLSQIASGKLNPKSLLPKRMECWKRTFLRKNGVDEWDGIFEHQDGRKMTEAEFSAYAKANPHIQLCFVTVIDTGVPIARSEKDVVWD